MSPKVSIGIIFFLMFSGAFMVPPARGYGTDIVATGGTITTSGNYTIHTFTTSGTFTVTSGSGNVEYLVVGGGGGGAYDGGGGGAGSYWAGTGMPVSVGAYTVTVGAGGLGDLTLGGSGNNGGHSFFNAINATGGGGGAGSSLNGLNGGSGGGAGGSAAPQTGGTGVAGHGFRGGNITATGTPFAGAGGGGSTTKGGTVTSNNIAGGGGNGTTSSISGVSVTYAGGGGGGSVNAATFGSSGGGGGGAGCTTAGCVASAGTANTGGGGGGGRGGGGNGGSGIVIIRYLGPAAPDAIDDLTVGTITSTSVDLSWSAPSMNGGTLQRYQIYYITPCGTPTTGPINGTTATSYTVSSLASAECYSFNATAVTQLGINFTGANVVNATTLAFDEANFTIGSFNYLANNPVLFPIRYARTDNGSNTDVTVNYANTISLACDLRYTYSGTNHTYHGLVATPVSATRDETTFTLINSTNEITTFRCWNESGNETANYVLTQTDFLLKQQIADFRDGTYGTSGQIGAFDFITLIVVIIAMIGLNQKDEAVAGFFCVVAIAVLTFFEVIQWQTAIISALAVIILVAVSSQKKD